jgi:nitroreductase
MEGEAHSCPASVRRQCARQKNMEFNDLIEQRYSVRAYKADPVEPEKLQQVLEAARVAPSASNKQPYQFIVIHTQGREAELRRIYNKDWFVQPPLVICVCAVTATAWHRKYDGKDYSYVDATIALDHLILSAHNLGLGTCWIAAFDPVPAREVLQLPDDVEPVMFTTLGYPADQFRPHQRKLLSDLVRYERW